MPASTLVRFIDPEKGPVTSISSSPYPGFFRRKLWHSTARLHQDCGPCGMRTRVFVDCGGGWSRDKETSQCKAVVEAIERWAFRYHGGVSKDISGFEIDPTSNGFAALPADFGAEKVVWGGYCEALERWCLGHIWDDADIPLSPLPLRGTIVPELFSASDGRLHCFSTQFVASPGGQIARKEVFFRLCILETPSGGAIPGSACGTDPGVVLERAATEALVNLTAFKLMYKSGLSEFNDILEQRLYHFASRSGGYNAISEKVRGVSAGTRKLPEVVFSKRLSGPWEPEVIVHRVLVGDTRPVTSGGVDRFVI